MRATKALAWPSEMPLGFSSTSTKNAFGASANPDSEKPEVRAAAAVKSVSICELMRAAALRRELTPMPIASERVRPVAAVGGWVVDWVVGEVGVAVGVVVVGAEVERRRSAGVAETANTLDAMPTPSGSCVHVKTKLPNHLR